METSAPTGPGRSAVVDNKTHWLIITIGRQIYCVRYRHPRRARLIKRARRRRPVLQYVSRISFYLFLPRFPRETPRITFVPPPPTRPKTCAPPTSTNAFSRPFAFCSFGRRVARSSFIYLCVCVCACDTPSSSKTQNIKIEKKIEIK